MFDFGHGIVIENSNAKKPLSYSVAEYQVTNYVRGASASCMLPALDQSRINILESPGRGAVSIAYTGPNVRKGSMD